MFARNVTVYRLEGPDGNGPFNTTTKSWKHSKGEEIHIRHSNDMFPSPQVDLELSNVFNVENYREYFFSFPSIEIFLTAFTKEELKEFVEEYDYKIFKIILKGAYVSKYQVMFKKHRISEKIDITQEILKD